MKGSVGKRVRENIAHGNRRIPLRKRGGGYVIARPGSEQKVCFRGDRFLGLSRALMLELLRVKKKIVTSHRGERRVMKEQVVARHPRSDKNSRAQQKKSARPQHR